MENTTKHRYSQTMRGQPAKANLTPSAAASTPLHRDGEGPGVRLALSDSRSTFVHALLKDILTKSILIR
jgi:hypothetical protein